VKHLHMRRGNAKKQEFGKGLLKETLPEEGSEKLREEIRSIYYGERQARQMKRMLRIPRQNACFEGIIPINLPGHSFRQLLKPTV